MWILHAIEPCGSNPQFLPKHRLARFNPQRGESWGTRLDSKHCSFARSKVWVHITKIWHHMVNSLVQMLLRDSYMVLNSNIWWSCDIQLIGHGFSYACARRLYNHRFCVVNDILGHGTLSIHFMAKCSMKIWLARQQR